MVIESIELKNYRNYEELHMELNQGTNILYGDNARERQIFWNLPMFAAHPSPTGGKGQGYHPFWTG